MNVTRYIVRMSRPHSHRFEVEAEFPPTDGQLTVVLPVWTPGSYIVREFSRHLQQVTAETLEGSALPVTRLDKRSFQVDAAGRAVRFRYGVYANELTVRTSHLDGSHAYMNGANLFLYDEDRRGQEHRVLIEAPHGWRVFCALDRDGEELVAPDYDTLVDSPMEVGPHESFHFEAAGVPHEVVIHGEPQPDRTRLAEDFKRVCETAAALFGGVPMKRYVFLIHLLDKGRGGLEHMSSCAMVYSRFGLNTVRGWEDFLALAAHEYFHLWNVKRVRPRALVPYDYAQENYTRSLWLFEGGTSYYDMLLSRRAGVMSPQRYLLRLGEALTTLHGIPGRRVLTLEEASLQAWVKHYRPDENTPNSAVSYYLKGELVCWLLDLHIRRATSDQRSLDDVMRLLWQRYGDGRGVPKDDIEATASEIAGMDLTPFFERSLRSTDELDYSILSHVGLEIRFRMKESPVDKGGTPARSRDSKPKGHLGATVRQSGTVNVVYDHSPAQDAGLYSDDEIIALDGYKVDGPTLLSRCEERAPGDGVLLTVFRRDRLMEIPVVLGSKPEDAVYVARVDDPSEAQKEAFAAWMGARWEAC